MRRPSLFKTFTLLCFIIVVVYIFSVNNRTAKISNNELKTDFSLPPPQPVSQKTVENTITISFVVCDSRFNESLNVVKSVLLFTKSPVRFIIFSDENLKNKFEDTLKAWQKLARYRLTYEIHDIKFPKAHEKDWLNLFSKCAAQRLFIPDLVPHIDTMIYVDTDTLFLGPAEVLWQKFTEFNSSQISAMALEDDNPNVSWYPRFAKHPFYGQYGLNSGVMLMNLTRMRNFGWVDYVTPIMLKWKLYIPWGDQDIINIIFHYHPGAVRVLSCRHNYRPDQCMYGDACARAAAGVSVLHASRRAAHNNKQPAFQAIYRAIDEYEIGGDPRQVVLNMDKYLTAAPDSYCGNMKDAFLKLPLQILTPDVR
ncbi:glucoside xylosyltransferase 1 [Aricia agestis]|uniref:glucoside xylosyltransferase 1 n=1 Tax=Aricia agestis TaxID=91739 RepID=UPI001C20573B|nr:glucoside xylosyltransferase 1 [Aricia agestis]